MKAVASYPGSSQRSTRWRSIVTMFAALAVAGATAVGTSTAASAELAVGDPVYIGEQQGYGGTSVHAVYEQLPATGAPDYWAYCIEHNVTAREDAAAVIGDMDSYLGSNYFAESEVQGKVLWILAHSYPGLSLSDFGAAAGVPGISVNDAIEATQYAIWRYTDLTWDASWTFESSDSETAYWYLVDGANASSGLAPTDLVATADITAPAEVAANSLVGPFTVHTNQPSAAVAATDDLPITDAAGEPIDTAAVMDGQQIYLDLRGIDTAGSATITVSAAGSSATGKILSVPTTDGTDATTADHAQSVILVAPDTATIDADATVTWDALASQTTESSTSSSTSTSESTTVGTDVRSSDSSSASVVTSAGTTSIVATGNNGSDSSDALAETGVPSHTIALAAAGLVLVLLGGAVMVASRRTGRWVRQH